MRRRMPVRETKDVGMEAEVREERRCYTVGFQGGGGDHLVKECRQPPSGRRQVKFSPRVSKKKGVLLTP